MERLKNIKDKLFNKQKKKDNNKKNKNKINNNDIKKANKMIIQKLKEQENASKRIVKLLLLGPGMIIIIYIDYIMFIMFILY